MGYHGNIVSRVLLSMCGVLQQFQLGSWLLQTCETNTYLLMESGVISVDSAFYGRADDTTCAGGKPQMLYSCLINVVFRCNGKEWCEMNGNVFTEDPCSDTFKYMKTTYSCDGKVIHVLGADFGRRDHTTCAFRRNSTSFLTHGSCCLCRCDGKSSCEMRAAELVVGESCVDTSLYLEYSYTCNGKTSL
uniref:SUEL-type lectin domain-containing protein n=1 Tax=Neogobius melanostomus TaxID=47308 RepID=A0A8C6SF49_9GOBI